LQCLPYTLHNSCISSSVIWWIKIWWLLITILLCVRGRVTNNNGFWIWWLDLLTASFKSLLKINYNSSQSITA
jgi:hypothetical protein